MEFINKIEIAVKKASELAISSFYSRSFTISKKGGGSIVTNIDLEVELFLKKELAKIIPGAGFLTEEHKIEEGNEYCWVIDPIDGTRNFARGLPYFCITVALMRGGKIIAASTYSPISDQHFYAEYKSGSILNGKKLQSTGMVDKNKGLMITISPFLFKNQQLLSDLREKCRLIGYEPSFRICGAAALDLAYVASGVFDLAIFKGLNWWDAAAGILLIAESSQFVGQHDGSGFDQRFKSLIAGNKKLSEQLLPILRNI